MIELCKCGHARGRHINDRACDYRGFPTHDWPLGNCNCMKYDPAEHTPNETTRRAIQDSRDGKGERFDSTEELFEDLGIADKYGGRFIRCEMVADSEGWISFDSPHVERPCKFEAETACRLKNFFGFEFSDSSIRNKPDVVYHFTHDPISYITERGAREYLNDISVLRPIAVLFTKEQQ